MLVNLDPSLLVDVTREVMVVGTIVIEAVLLVTGADVVDGATLSVEELALVGAVVASGVDEVVCTAAVVGVVLAASDVGVEVVFSAAAEEVEVLDGVEVVSTADVVAGVVDSGVVDDVGAGDVVVPDAAAALLVSEPLLPVPERPFTKPATSPAFTELAARRRRKTLDSCVEIRIVRDD